jgi:hypothetical protein
MQRRTLWETIIQSVPLRPLVYNTKLLKAEPVARGA